MKLRKSQRCKHSKNNWIFIDWQASQSPSSAWHERTRPNLSRCFDLHTALLSLINSTFWFSLTLEQLVKESMSLESLQYCGAHAIQRVTWNLSKSIFIGLNQSHWHPKVSSHSFVLVLLLPYCLSIRAQRKAQQQQQQIFERVKSEGGGLWPK